MPHRHTEPVVSEAREELPGGRGEDWKDWEQVWKTGNLGLHPGKHSVLETSELGPATSAQLCMVYGSRFVKAYFNAKGGRVRHATGTPVWISR